MVSPFYPAYSPWIMLMYLDLQANELDQKIQEVYKHIQTERKILEASQQLGRATANQEVLGRNAAKIRETEKNLAYYEQTLRELQARKLQQQQQSQRDDPSRSEGLLSPQVSSPSSVPSTDHPFPDISHRLGAAKRL
jgi:phage/plasmid primase-like uncharacterized protein